MSNGTWEISMKKLGGQRLGCTIVKLLPKVEDVLTYRDQSFPSKFTGTPSPIHLRNFMHALDDSLETFMNKIKK